MLLYNAENICLTCYHKEPFVNTDTGWDLMQLILQQKESAFFYFQNCLAAGPNTFLAYSSSISCNVTFFQCIAVSDFDESKLIKDEGPKRRRRTTSMYLG